MSSKPTPQKSQVSKILEEEYLPLRAKILELGAALDRLELADTNFSKNPKVLQLLQAIKLLIPEGLSEDTNDESSNGKNLPDGKAQARRAEKIQLHFSRIYNESWRKEYDI
ncbi:MAG: hypothetical protein MPJ24_02200 [Pirellulaceae bacterium]|nr:hypothetical protein [Pirellulaceae bacterium]